MQGRVTVYTAEGAPASLSLQSNAAVKSACSPNTSMPCGGNSSGQGFIGSPAQATVGQQQWIVLRESKDPLRPKVDFLLARGFRQAGKQLRRAAKECVEWALTSSPTLDKGYWKVSDSLRDYPEFTASLLDTFLPSYLHQDVEKRARSLNFMCKKRNKDAHPGLLAELDDIMEEAAESLAEYTDLRASHKIESDIVDAYFSGGRTFIIQNNQWAEEYKDQEDAEINTHLDSIEGQKQECASDSDDVSLPDSKRRKTK